MFDAEEKNDELIDDQQVTDETSVVGKAATKEKSDAPKMRWYVVQAYSGYEARVQKTLLERVKQFGLDDKFGEILVPTEEVVEMKAGQKRRSERKFFPGYVLVNMVMDDETWHLVCKTPRVNGFIGGTSDNPAPISEQEAEKILQRMEQGADKPRPKIIFEPGEVVRVIDGPFADFNGVVEEVNYEKSRLQVAVLIFGRSTPVELEFGQVEKG
jgi:transcriptional antiterminator NusG